MWKKDLEKLELDIAREKDHEVAERLKAVLEAKQRERRERNLRFWRVVPALRPFGRMLADVLPFVGGVFLLLLAVMCAGVVVAQIVGGEVWPPRYPGDWLPSAPLIPVTLFAAALGWVGVIAIRYARRSWTRDEDGPRPGG